MSLVGLVIASLIPAGYLEGSPVKFSDKIQHALAYGYLGCVGFAAYPGHIFRVAGGLFFIGLLIEIIQGATGWRHGEVLDLVANLVGILVVWGIFHLKARNNNPA